MAGQSYYGSGAIMSAGFDLNSPAPLDYKSLIASWGSHTETIEEQEVTVYDVDVIPFTALYVGMIVADNTSGIVKSLKTIPSGATSAHDCTWEEIGTHVKPDWNAASGTDAEILHKPNIPIVNDATYSVKTNVSGTETTVSDFTANQSTADSITFVQGSNVTLTPDSTNKKITIAATDTTYTAGNGISITNNAISVIALTQPQVVNILENGIQQS